MKMTKNYHYQTNLNFDNLAYLQERTKDTDSTYCGCACHVNNGEKNVFCMSCGCDYRQQERLHMMKTLFPKELKIIKDIQTGMENLK